MAHSKGGVDVRQYLSQFQANHNEQFRILSYTSLSTAHHGSVLGDLVIAESEFPLPGNEVRLEGFSISCAYLSLYQMQLSSTLWQGHVDVSTTQMSSFNLHNLALLPQDIHYNLMGADADANNNGELDIPNEMADGDDLISWAYKVEIGKWKYHHLSNAFKQMYDLLKTTKGLTVSYEVADTVDGEGLTIVKAVNFSKPVMNDIFVNEVSATADSTRLYHAARHRFTFHGPDARSHMGMLNEGVAYKVIPWLLEADQTHEYGDLQ